MSSVTHTPQSNYQLILHALASYADQTGIDLSTNPFADKLQDSELPDAILELLHDREKAFKEYREGNRKLIHWLTPAVQVLHAFGEILGESLSLVSSTASIPCLALVSCHFFRSLSHQQKQSSLASIFFLPCVPSCHQPDPSDVQYVRLRVASVQVVTLSLTSSSVSAISFSVSLFIPGFRPPMR